MKLEVGEMYMLIATYCHMEGKWGKTNNLVKIIDTHGEIWDVTFTWINGKEPPFNSSWKRDDLQLIPYELAEEINQL